MNYWWILYVIDGIFFFGTVITVLYCLVFSVASLFYRKPEISKAKRQNRFIVLIPAYKKDDTVLQTVNSVLGQTYPQRLFDVIVVSDHQSEMTNMRLAQLPVTLLTPDFDESTKAKSMQYAILNLPQFKIYDAVLVLDADNLIESEYLEQVNDAFESSGTKAIQTHRLSRNRDTAISRLDTIFEEINNAIFRRGHTTLGLSASLNGSGMVYDFEWFKEHVMRARTAGEDKELEAMLLKEDIFIDYFDNIHLYDEKTRHVKSFYRQRGRWASTQFHALVSEIRLLPWSVLNRHYDFTDKLIQWMIVPRTILMSFILTMCVVLPFIYFTLAIKWWIAAALVMFSFSLATPDALVDKNWDKDFLYAPVLITLSFINIVVVLYTEARSRLMATWHLIGRLRS